MLPIAPILLILFCATPAAANVAMPIYEGDPGYERARLANSYGVLALILGVVAIALFWNWVERRTGSSLGCAVGGTITAVYAICALAFVTISRPIGFQPAPAPGVEVWAGYDRNNRPWTAQEIVLPGLVLSFLISVAGFLLLRKLRDQSKRVDSPQSASDNPAAQI